MSSTSTKKNFDDDDDDDEARKAQEALQMTINAKKIDKFDYDKNDLYM
jgi:hypothetical protein